MTRFGPSGNSQSFYAQGHQATVQAPPWLQERGLTAMEYACGRGVNISLPSAAAIGEQAARHGVVMSVHAPYFINLSNDTPEKVQDNRRWIVDSARVADAMGGSRIVVHPGSGSGQDRPDLLRRAIAQMKLMVSALADEGLAHVRICPETMGKRNQLGHEAEIYALCEADETLIPCFDFAHIHALHRGGLNSCEDFARTIDEAERVLGRERLLEMHVHFSHVEYTKGGERRHVNFCDEGFGPDFAHLARVIKPRRYHPVFISESRGNMAEDAMEMMRIWHETPE